MPDALARPSFDPELATFLTRMQEHGPFTLTTSMLPRMRELELAEEDLRARGLERRTVTIPGHDGDLITAGIIQRAGRTGTAARIGDI